MKPSIVKWLLITLYLVHWIPLIEFNCQRGVNIIIILNIIVVGLLPIIVSPVSAEKQVE